MADTDGRVEPSADGRKKHSKRVITAARKEQNRVAQRAYRRRQKEQRLANKALARKDHSKPLEIRPYAAEEDHSTSSNIESDHQINDLHERELLLPQEPMIAEPSHELSISGRFLIDDIPATQPNHRLANLDVNSDIWGTFDPTVLSELVDTASPNVINLSALSITTLNTPDFSFMQTSPSTNGSSPDSASTLMKQIQSANRATGNASHPAIPVQNRIENDFGTDDSSDSSQLDIVTRPYSNSERSLMDPKDPFQLADPYRNAIQFSDVTIIQICVLNAQCLGLSPEQFINSDCYSLCSPFYRSASASDDPKALLAAVTKSSTPKHLQPTLSQILFPHHPMLDLIPLPGFREKAIMLACTNPALLDPLELKGDIMQGGLICWGARHDPFHGGSGQPWDLRSWEAAPWFLKKWQLLVGGKDGELWKQSMWWRNLRGEAIEI